MQTLDDIGCSVLFKLRTALSEIFRAPVLVDVLRNVMELLLVRLCLLHIFLFAAPCAFNMSLLFYPISVFLTKLRSSLRCRSHLLAAFFKYLLSQICILCSCATPQSWLIFGYPNPPTQSIRTRIYRWGEASLEPRGEGGTLHACILIGVHNPEGKANQAMAVVEGPWPIRGHKPHNARRMYWW